MQAHNCRNSNSVLHETVQFFFSFSVLSFVHVVSAVTRESLPSGSLVVCSLSSFLFWSICLIITRAIPAGSASKANLPPISFSIPLVMKSFTGELPVTRSGDPRTVNTPDATALMYQLCQDEKRPDFTLYNYGGFILPTVNEFAQEISRQTGGPSKVQNLPKFVMNIMALFMPVMKELKENYYLFENSVNLNDEKIRKTFPDFRHTSFEQAVSETLTWFKENYNK